jgi:uncharacterized damage-inducible protein DinB
MALDVHASLPLLRTVFERNLKVLASSAEGVDEAGARVPVVEGGSHFHWLLAHLVASRDALLERLGAERVWTAEAAKAFGRGSAPSVPEGATLADHLGRLRAQQELLDAVLPTLDAAALAREAGRMSVGGWIEFLAWHESYHVGQATLYRRVAGLPSAIG